MTDTKDLTFVTFNVLHDMMDRYSAIAELNDSSYRFEIILEVSNRTTHSEIRNHHTHNAHTPHA
eukprot:m.142399 g.142399  ORF g.142399 m.142399 type:complete len:64 (+) comp24183_c1_seq1:154-345(+)